ncbi:hypothetical protein CBR_g18962 [Chara braunii]|uniref:Gamma-glutamylcyclotransferase family protein n=1 Tax=Chara braunii TaxID=69332 RepID=A0A388KWY0_CHABU|nr:hypothetical protein CBR_g18962 [Chara braunii]|eukprot:GBG74551.1 hypothetical protein CBR_g18962 [Chara braunii]
MASAVVVSTRACEGRLWSEKEMRENASLSGNATRVKVEHLSPSDARGSGDASGVDVVDFLPAAEETERHHHQSSYHLSSSSSPTQSKSHKKVVIKNPCGIAFVYGTLKKGFGNYWLMQDLLKDGHVEYIGSARTKQPYPLVCGPFAVPFLLDMPSNGWCVKGELYKVDAKAQEILDEKEGTTVGHYVRKPLVLTDVVFDRDFVSSPADDDWYRKGEGEGEGGGEVLAEAYFAHNSITQGLAKASATQFIEAFTEAQARHYIVRKDRPKNRTFLEHVRLWIHERTREKRQP